MPGGNKITRSTTIVNSYNPEDNFERLITKICTNFSNQLEHKMEEGFGKFESSLN